MKNLIIINIAAGVVLVITSFFFATIPGNMWNFLFWGQLHFLFLLLILVNFIYIFILWRKYKYRSFIPLAIALICFFLSPTMRYFDNSPRRPQSYFNEKNKQELTIIAEELLQSSEEEYIQATKDKLKEYDLVVMNANACEDVVEFGYYCVRNWYTYTFSKSELPEIYCGEPIITECDILDWGELVGIIKTENDPSKYKREEMVFELEIVYPFLAEHLDGKYIDKLIGLPSIKSLDSFLAKHENQPITEALNKRHSDYNKIITSRLSKEERLKVIEVLNKHCHISSKLIENENIRLLKKGRPPYIMRGTLEFCKQRRFSPSFQVTKHLHQLISDGVIRVKDEEGHLEVKSNLTDKEKRNITWLQIELMNCCYGNLIEKIQYSSTGKTKLSDNWYFYTD